MAEDSERIPDRLIQLSLDAREDQNEIYLYTAKVWGVAQAGNYLLFLEEVLKDLAERPQIAHFEPRLNGVRVYIAQWQNAKYGHRIFFEEHEEGIIVLRILHTSQDWNRILEG